MQEPDLDRRETLIQLDDRRTARAEPSEPSTGSSTLIIATPSRFNTFYANGTRRATVGYTMKNLTGMAIFAWVVEARSFSEAARRLGLSKSMVSKEVSRLEKSLGARRLNRTTRKLSLTQIGAACYEHCARIVQEANDAELLVGGGGRHLALPNPHRGCDTGRQQSVAADVVTASPNVFDELDVRFEVFAASASGICSITVSAQARRRNFIALSASVGVACGFYVTRQLQTGRPCARLIKCNSN